MRMQRPLGRVLKPVGCYSLLSASVRTQKQVYWVKRVKEPAVRDDNTSADSTQIEVTSLLVCCLVINSRSKLVMTGGRLDSGK